MRPLRAFAVVTQRIDDLLLVAGVTLIGAILRVEALVGSYGPAPLGQSLETLQRFLAQLGPWLHGGRLVWHELGPRSGDPVAYLNNARAMTWFYEGRAREPVFNYATQWGLWLTDDAAIGVSLASVLFSLLCVPATYVMGRLAFGRVAGVIAAFIVAIEPDLLRWGVQGWRDDTFTFFTVAFAACSLLFLRRPSRGHAALVAITAALALLTRLTALSYIAPGLVLLATAARTDGLSRRQILARVAHVIVVSSVLVAPYLVNCWLRYGDPFVSVNRNTTFYRERAGLDASDQMDAGAYLAMLARDRPVAMIDTASQGVTTYPFRNKFQTLSPWGPALPAVLPVLTVIGLLAWPWTPQGRLLLVVLVLSLVPFAFTWEIPGGAEWRFTMHAYPFYLVAAASAIPLAASTVRRMAQGVRPDRRSLLRATASFAVAGVLTAVLLWLPAPRFRESLVVDGAATIVPGWRDRVFFRRGWNAAAGRSRRTERTSRGDVARLYVPLPPTRAYHVSASITPALDVPAAPLFLRAFVNGHEVAWKALPDERSEPYTFDVNANIVPDRGSSLVEFRANRVPLAGSPVAEDVLDLRDARFTLWSFAVTVDERPDVPDDPIVAGP